MRRFLTTSRRFLTGLQQPKRLLVILLAIVVFGLVMLNATRISWFGVVDSAADVRASVPTEDIPPPTKTPTKTKTPIPTKTPTVTNTPLPTSTFTPTSIPTATLSTTVSAASTSTPTATIDSSIGIIDLDLSTCNAAGCGVNAKILPTAVYSSNLLLAATPHQRRDCPECPTNPVLSEAELNQLLQANPATLARLRAIALSQETYEVAPGIVYIVHKNVHHVVIDLAASDFTLRNVLPTTVERGTLIPPSYCYTPNSLIVMDADYHGLNGSNKLETGEVPFHHQGRAALFDLNGRFDLDIIRDPELLNQTNISWGSGPIFMWDGAYNYNPFQEWFEEEALEYYRTTRWAKATIAITENRQHLFLSVSYGQTMESHANNIIELGQKWGLKPDRAMRFDGGESAYLSIRIGDKMVPLLELEEPLIVNCFVVERMPAPQTSVAISN